MTTARRTVTLERTFHASIEDVWKLLTTKAGLESWWGPDGFKIEVRTLELRPGGRWEYAMIATAPEQIAFMKQAGMPLSTEQRVTYTEVSPLRRLAYENVVDFIPGVAAYTAAALVELSPHGQSVKLVLTLDAMHDERWTEMARMGWESQLGKLSKVLAS